MVDLGGAGMAQYPWVLYVSSGKSDDEFMMSFFRCLLLICCCPWVVVSQDSFVLLSQKTDTLYPGLVHNHRALRLGMDTVRLDILEADLNLIRVGSVLAKDQVIGQETVSQMVERSGALAGVNGGFSFSNDPWNTFHGDPRDLYMYDGEMLSEPLSSRSSFAIVEESGHQRPVFDQFTWRGRVTIGGESFQLTGVNRMRDSTDVIVYTPEFNRSTLTNGKGREYLCRGEECQMVEGGSAIIPQNGFVLSLGPSYVFEHPNLPQRGSYKLGHTFSSKRSILKTAPTYIWTAGPTLLQHGDLALHFGEESIQPSFGSTRHPRTAVGYNPESHTLWLVTVDGRQPGWSAGIRLDDLARYFLEIGATEAYNLDGGGSTTMAIGDRVVNRYSDPQERRRCDAVVLFLK